MAMLSLGDIVPLTVPNGVPVQSVQDMLAQMTTTPAGSAMLAAAGTGGAASTGGAGTTMGPITLFDGSVVQDPVNTPPTAAQCMPGKCAWPGASTDYLLWCAQAGYVGNLTCDNPACAPYCPSNPYAPANASVPTPATMTNPAPAVPQSMTATMPSMTQTAAAVTGMPGPQPPALTPQMLQNRLPTIIQSAPVNVQPPCDPITEFVGNNTLLVGLALAAGLMWAWGGRNGRQTA